MTKLQNPYNCPAEWTEEEPWDIINCFKCQQAWKVPAMVYEVWIRLDFGCPFCYLEESECLAKATGCAED